MNPSGEEISAIAAGLPGKSTADDTKPSPHGTYDENQSPRIVPSEQRRRLLGTAGLDTPRSALRVVLADRTPNV
jgi:hypothetical protein